MSESTAHMIYEATTKQITGLELEREAHLQQIAGLAKERRAHLQQIASLIAERDALRVELGYKQAECEELQKRLAQIVSDRDVRRAADRALAYTGDDHAEPDLIRVPILGSVDSASGAITWNEGVALA